MHFELQTPEPNQEDRITKKYIKMTVLDLNVVFVNAASSAVPQGGEAVAVVDLLRDVYYCMIVMVVCMFVVFVSDMY